MRTMSETNPDFLKASPIFRVAIHGRDDISPIEDDGINVGPNTATDISIQHVSIE